MNMDFLRKLPLPMDIKAEYPLGDAAAKRKAEWDREISRVIRGEDQRLLLLIGPCSADAEEPVMEYLSRLSRLREQVSDKILIVPRVYTNKPRSSGSGYFGMLHQPDPDSRPDLLAGVVAIRRLFIRAITEADFPIADEMLYPENHRLFSDLLSYAAVGARSVENQQHRLTASGLDIPVGMKNPPSGDLGVTLNAVRTAQTPHTFLYRGWEVESHGNPLSHIILRGYLDREGNSCPNCDYDSLRQTVERYAEAGLENPFVVVDTNHCNSGKRFGEEPRIAKDVLMSAKRSREIAKTVRGLMIESYLLDGARQIGEGTPGQSITDPCLGWEKTERLVFDLADLL